MKSISILIAAMSAITVPAFAADPAANAKADASASVPASAKGSTRRYCITEQPTGSRLSRKTCHTKAEWALEGVDIDAESK